MTAPRNPETLLAELRREALRRHRRHVGSVHRSYGGSVGLVSRRGTNRLRYAPTDELPQSADPGERAQPHGV